MYNYYNRTGYQARKIIMTFVIDNDIDKLILFIYDIGHSQHKTSILTQPNIITSASLEIDNKKDLF